MKERSYINVSESCCGNGYPRQNGNKDHQVRVQRRRSAHPEGERRRHVCGLFYCKRSDGSGTVELRQRQRILHHALYRRRNRERHWFQYPLSEFHQRLLGGLPVRQELAGRRGGNVPHYRGAAPADCDLRI